MVDEITNDMFSDGYIENINIDSLSWLNKYSPKKISDCLLKTEEKKRMKDWIENLIKRSKESPNNSEQKSKDTSKKSGKSTKSKTKSSKNNLDANCLFLYGPPGIGKTTIANILLKEYNFDILEFNASDTRTAKIIQDRLNKIGGSHNVIDFMCNKKTKIAVILDEIDGLSSGDKGGMTEINNIIADSKDKHTPFICISNNVCKKTDSLKRKSLFMKISKPSDVFIKNIVTKISKNENLNFQPDLIKKIVAKSQGDIRRCITLLEYIFRNKSNPSNNINMEINFKQNEPNNIKTLNDNDDNNDDDNNDKDFDFDFDKEVDNYSRKLTELQPYEMCEKILNSNNNLDFFLSNFNFDQSMTNWYIYENFVKYIDKNRIGNIEKKINNIGEIYECFTKADLFEKEVMVNQNYDFFEYINIIKTHGSSFWTNHDLKRASYNKMGMMNYSTLLNKTSLEYSNSKNWGNVNLSLESNQDTNITGDLCNIIYKKIEANDTKFIKNIISSYNLDLEQFEKIIKMSSFYDKTQQSLFTEMKKKIKIYYNN